MANTFLRSDLIILDKLFGGANFKTFLLTDQNDFKSKEQTIFSPYYSAQEMLSHIQQAAPYPVVIINTSVEDLSLIAQESNVYTIIDCTMKASLKWLQSKQQIRRTRFSYINNPDKSIRWIYPSKNKKASFLNLYNSSGWKAKMYKFALKKAFQFKLQGLLNSGQFTVWHRHQLPVENWISDYQFDDYSIFTGTVGENRKAIIECSQKGKSSHFVKLPLGHKAEDIVDTEYEILQRVGNLSLKKIALPSATRIAAGVIQSNVRPNTSSNIVNIERRHLDALYELYNRTVKQKPLEKIQAWQLVQTNLKQLDLIFESKNEISKSRLASFKLLLQQLNQRFDANQTLTVGMAHGDFTPWNMYVGADKIHVYDWELAEAEMPLLFDAFHFIFQSNILVQQANFTRIQDKIRALSKEPIVQAMQKEFEINFEQVYQFYLLYTISYYVPLYLQQEDLHLQAHWLMDAWEASLQSVLQTGERA